MGDTRDSESPEIMQIRSNCYANNTAICNRSGSPGLEMRWVALDLYFSPNARTHTRFHDILVVFVMIFRFGKWTWSSLECVDMRKRVSDFHQYSDTSHQCWYRSVWCVCVCVLDGSILCNKAQFEICLCAVNCKTPHYVIQLGMRAHLLLQLRKAQREPGCVCVWVWSSLFFRLVYSFLFLADLKKINE